MEFSSVSPEHKATELLVIEKLDPFMADDNYKEQLPQNSR